MECQEGRVAGSQQGWRAMGSQERRVPGVTASHGPSNLPPLTLHGKTPARTGTFKDKQRWHGSALLAQILPNITLYCRAVVQFHFIPWEAPGVASPLKTCTAWQEKCSKTSQQTKVVSGGIGSHSATPSRLQIQFLTLF